MENIYDYKVVISDNGRGTLFIKPTFDSVFEELTDLGNLEGKSAVEVNEIASVALRSNDLQISHELETVWEDKAKDTKDDLKYVRKEMKKLLKFLSNPEVSVSDKKNNLAIYQTMCASAQMIVNASKLELAYETINTKRKLLK